MTQPNNLNIQDNLRSLKLHIIALSIPPWERNEDCRSGFCTQQRGMGPPQLLGRSMHGNSSIVPLPEACHENGVDVRDRISRGWSHHWNRGFSAR